MKMKKREDLIWWLGLNDYKRLQCIIGNTFNTNEVENCLLDSHEKVIWAPTGWQDEIERHLIVYLCMYDNSSNTNFYYILIDRETKIIEKIEVYGRYLLTEII